MELALAKANGIIKVETKEQTYTFSEKFACPDCGISYPEIAPRMFSFNNPYGACPSCFGLGVKEYFDPDLIVPNPDLSLRDGAILPLGRKASGAFPAFSRSPCKTLQDRYPKALQGTPETRPECHPLWFKG